MKHPDDALFDAVSTGNTKAVKHLINSRVYSDAIKVRLTALATKHGYMDIVELLSSNFARVLLFSDEQD